MKSYELELQDDEAISILVRFPEEERSRVAAKYIIIGDTVVRYAQIVTSEESIQRYFDPITTDWRTLSANLESTRKQLEDRIPETLKASLDRVITQLTEAATSLETLRGGYQDLLAPIIPTLSKSSTKGAVSCKAVFQSLQSAFRDDRFEDVSSKARFTDILGTPSFGKQSMTPLKKLQNDQAGGANVPLSRQKQPELGERAMKSEHAGARMSHHLGTEDLFSVESSIHIEVKDYSDPVGSSEVNKFWRDMEARKAPIGCFLSMRTPIRNVTPDFSIVVNGSRMGIFVVSEAMGGQGHIFGYTVARKMLEMMSGRRDTVKAERYEWMADVLNNRMQEFNISLRELEKIENGINKARENIDQTLRRVSHQILNLRTKLETIIEITVRDFSEEVVGG